MSDEAAQRVCECTWEQTDSDTKNVVIVGILPGAPYVLPRSNVCALNRDKYQNMRGSFLNSFFFSGGQSNIM